MIQGAEAEDNISDFPIEGAEDLTSKQFYDSIELFHKKVKNLHGIIINYYQTRGMLCEKEFFAIQFYDGKIHDMVDSIYHNIQNITAFKEVFEFWFEHKDNSQFVENIYKIEIENNIFLFKFFSFKDSKEEGVISGYFLKNSIDVRLLLLSLSNAYITSNYNTISNFIR